MVVIIITVGRLAATRREGSGVGRHRIMDLAIGQDARLKLTVASRSRGLDVEKGAGLAAKTVAAAVVLNMATVIVLISVKLVVMTLANHM